VWGRLGVGWGGLLGRLEVFGCKVGVSKISATHAGVGRGGLKFCEYGVGADKKFQPTQDSGG